MRIKVVLIEKKDVEEHMGKDLASGCSNTFWGSIRNKGKESGSLQFGIMVCRSFNKASKADSVMWLSIVHCKIFADDAK